MLGSCEKTSRAAFRKQCRNWCHPSASSLLPGSAVCPCRGEAWSSARLWPFSVCLHGQHLPCCAVLLPCVLSVPDSWKKKNTLLLYVYLFIHSFILEREKMVPKKSTYWLNNCTTTHPIAIIFVKNHCKKVPGIRPFSFTVNIKIVTQGSEIRG